MLKYYIKYASPWIPGRKNLDTGTFNDYHSWKTDKNYKTTMPYKAYSKVGGKKGNRTEPTEYIGRSLRKFPIVAVTGFTSVTDAILTIYFIIISFLVFYQTNYSNF